MDFRTLAVVAAVATAFAIAGCSSPSGDGQRNGPVTPPMEDGKYVIRMLGTSFQPADAKVPAGATVVWVGVSGTHDVTEDGGAWSSDDSRSKLLPQDRYERTFGEAGVVGYHCKVHKSTGMVGTVTVE